MGISNPTSTLDFDLELISLIIPRFRCHASGHFSKDCQLVAIYFNPT